VFCIARLESCRLTGIHCRIKRRGSGGGWCYENVGSKKRREDWRGIQARAVWLLLLTNERAAILKEVICGALFLCFRSPRAFFPHLR